MACASGMRSDCPSDEASSILVATAKNMVAEAEVDEAPDCESGLLAGSSPVGHPNGGEKQTSLRYLLFM